MRKSNAKGYLNKETGVWSKYKGWKAPALATGAMIAASVVLPFAFSKVGQILDQAGQADLNRRKHYYNTAYYSTEQYEQSAYQQIGASLDQMESRMVSMSRLMHHRG